jgi:S1-C subfamily serine protease
VNVKQSVRCACWSLVLLAAAAAVAAPVAAAAETPPDSAHSDADLDAQLAAARAKLEEAAHEVARLSTEASGTMIDRVMPYFAGGRAIIGVQLEGAAGGARVREVSPGGPAAEAGIKVGDLIVAVNGTELKDAAPARQVVHIMRDVKPDTKVSVRVLRAGKARDFTVTARPGPGVFAAFSGPPDLDFGPFGELPETLMLHRPLTDMELATLTPRLGSYFGTDKGVLVVRAPADGALHLEDGDVILAIDGREPSSGSHATRILGSYQPGEKITLRIVRAHRTQELQGTLPERAHPHHDMMFRTEPMPPPGPKVLMMGADEA